MSYAPYQDCINACKTCANLCDLCATSSQDEPNPGMLQRCSALAVDCAAFCRLTVDYMIRGSEFCDLVCEDCAEICSVCAEECVKHNKTNHCQKCAEACRKCTEECLKMISH